MQEPEPRPTSDRSSADGTRPPSALAPAPSDPPTVRTGSAARRPRPSAGQASAPFPEPGERIDSFELEEAIGAGGMGAVFRAHDSRLERLVALKILPPEQANDPEVVQRFYQEGRAAARLDQENIARVYTIGNDGTYHYIAFEYIEGTTIRQRVERTGVLPVAEAINYTLQIATALVHAAERGVVHRDIKPSNIIVTPQGRAKLVDMGLARRFERGGDDGLTQSGMTLGTFDYISPEQARDPRDVDVRSDLYSLGCTLFHMLTGRPPFPEGTVLQKLLQHQEEPPPEVRSLNPSVPPDLASILDKLMAKDRDRRYQTPEQLVRDLLTVAGALGLRSVSPEGLTWMAASRPPAWERHLVWGFPVLAFLLVVAGLVWWGQGQDANGPSSIADAVPGLPGPAHRHGPVEPAARDDEGRSGGVIAAEPAPAAKRETIVPRDLVVESTEDLLAIVANAPPRSVIVLADDGPYYLRSGGGERLTGPLAGRDLTIQADAGARPVVRRTREPLSGPRTPAALFDFRGGHVTLEGIEFVLDPGEHDEILAAIQTEDTELTVRRCLFRHPGSRSSKGRAAALSVRANAPGAAHDARPAAVVADACHFDGGQIGVLARGPVDVLLRDCSLAAAEPAVWFDNGHAAGAVPAELRLRHDSILAGDGPVFRFDGSAPRVRIEDSVVAPSHESRATLIASDAPEALDWRGRGNLYGRIGTYLEPTGKGPGAEPVRDFARWAETPAEVRETGSNATKAQVWDEADPNQSLAQETRNPTRFFRISATAPGNPDTGTRQGPDAALAPVVKTASNPIEPRPERRAIPPPVSAPLPSPTPTPDHPAATVTEPAEPAEPVVAETAPAPIVRMADMPEMPVVSPPAGTGREKEKERVESPPPVAAAEAPGTDPAVLRSSDQFLNALNEPAARGGTLRVAADANWELSSVPIKTEARWTARAEPGPTRPRIRFRPAPADPKSPAAWSSCLELQKGTLQLEGFDILLAQADAPRQGRWAAFSVWGGTDLRLTNCTVTIEGEEPVSAVVVVPAGTAPGDGEAGAAAAEPSSANVQLTDCLFRAGGDLIVCTGGHRLVLDLNNAVVSTRGSLLHAHGRARGLAADPIQLTLRQVTARTLGGLVQLESSPDEPDLPRAEVTARDSILTTTHQDSPLLRVDGQENIAALHDRIRWEGHGVAYHLINAYRRDQTAQVGAVPKLYDRPSWVVAVGTNEASPVHGDLKFLQDFDPTRPAWALRRDDVRLAPESPAETAGADLARVPNAPDPAP